MTNLYLKIQRKLRNSNIVTLLKVYELRSENNIELLITINLPATVKIVNNINKVIKLLETMTYRKIEMLLLHDTDSQINEYNWDNLYNELSKLDILLDRIIAEDKIENELMKLLIDDLDILNFVGNINDCDKFMKVLCDHLLGTSNGKKNNNILGAKYAWKHGNNMIRLLLELEKNYPIGYYKLVKYYVENVLNKEICEKGKVYERKIRNY